MQLVLAQRPHLLTFLDPSEPKLSIEELTILLRQTLKGLNSEYMFLDALKECTDQKYLFKFIEALMTGTLRTDMYSRLVERKMITRPPLNPWYHINFAYKVHL